MGEIQNVVIAGVSVMPSPNADCPSYKIEATQLQFEELQRLTGLVYQASGLLGSAIVQEFLKSEFHVSVLTRPDSKAQFP